MMRLVLYVAALTGLAVVAQGRDERAQLLEEARRAALNYSNWLPDLICTEVVRRDVDWTAGGGWSYADSLTAQVTYFQRRESYKLVAHNGHSANQKFENLTGAISEGEFGSMLRWIFDPDAKAEFEWNAAGRIRRRAVSVFTYRVDAANSRLEMMALSHSIIAGFHGSVYIDDERKLILRLMAETDGPPHFPIRESFTSIDYDWRDVGGRSFLVPVLAEVRMTENPPASCVSCDPPNPALRGGVAPTPTKYRNRIEFRNYRKFTADSTLRFEGSAESPRKH